MFYFDKPKGILSLGFVEIWYGVDAYDWNIYGCFTDFTFDSGVYTADTCTADHTIQKTTSSQ